MKKFTSNTGQPTVLNEQAEPIEFMIDEDTFTARPPTPEQYIFFLSSQAQHRNQADVMAGAVDFIDGLLDEPDRQALRRRLLNRNDPLEFTIIEDIVMYLMEEWSDHPTQSPSDSSVSPPSIGPRSTARRRSTG